jgi:hypothetical protein
MFVEFFGETRYVVAMAALPGTFNRISPCGGFHYRFVDNDYTKI